MQASRGSCASWCRAAHPVPAWSRSGERDFQSFADAFGEKIADLGVTRDGLDEAVGGIEPDGMPPSFAFQDAALFLQMADEVAALHLRKKRSAFAATSGAALDEHGGLLGTARNTLHRFLPLVIQHRLNRRRKVFEAGLPRPALSVGFRDFGANGHEPFAFMYDDSGISVLHGCFR